MPPVPPVNNISIWDGSTKTLSTVLWTIHILWIYHLAMEPTLTMPHHHHRLCTTLTTETIMSCQTMSWEQREKLLTNATKMQSTGNCKYGCHPKEQFLLKQLHQYHSQCYSSLSLFLFRPLCVWVFLPYQYWNGWIVCVADLWCWEQCHSKITNVISEYCLVITISLSAEYNGTTSTMDIITGSINSALWLCNYH